MQTLTTSQLNYMICIRTLSGEGNVRATDISRQIGLSMPSVHHMLGTLESMGLVEKHRHSVTLTPASEETLSHYDRALAAAEALLGSLGIEDRKDDAMMLVTSLSRPAMDKIIEKFS